MEMTLTFPNEISKQLQKLPNPSDFVSKVVKEALKNKTDQPDSELKEFQVMEWLRQVRDEHYELLKGKTTEEKVAFYREGARRVHERAKKRGFNLKKLDLSLNNANLRGFDSPATCGFFAPRRSD